MKKLLLIINPIAGQQKAEKKLPELLAVFREAGYETELLLTEAKGDAFRRVQEAADVDRIVCAGGDGTLQEVVGGLLESGLSIPLGYIPCGSTNDFGTSLGLPADILSAAHIACEADVVPIDIGRFGDRVFSYVASFGAFTPASYSAPQKLKNRIGHAAYVLQGARELRTLHPYRLRLECSEGIYEGEYLMGAVSNSTSVAGILTLDKSKVSLNDGLFEVLLVPYTRNPFRFVRTVSDLLHQRYDQKHVVFFSTEAVRIMADPSMPWSLDGEKQEGSSEVRACVMPAAIRLALPC